MRWKLLIILGWSYLGNPRFRDVGAGELLGNEQSGQIEGIGFSLYMELLDGSG